MLRDQNPLVNLVESTPPLEHSRSFKPLRSEWIFSEPVAVSGHMYPSGKADGGLGAAVVFWPFSHFLQQEATKHSQHFNRTWCCRDLIGDKMEVMLLVYPSMAVDGTHSLMDYRPSILSFCHYTRYDNPLISSMMIIFFSIRLFSPPSHFDVWSPDTVCHPAADLCNPSLNSQVPGSNSLVVLSDLRDSAHGHDHRCYHWLYDVKRPLYNKYVNQRKPGFKHIQTN